MPIYHPFVLALQALGQPIARPSGLKPLVKARCMVAPYIRRQSVFKIVRENPSPAHGYLNEIAVKGLIIRKFAGKCEEFQHTLQASQLRILG